MTIETRGNFPSIDKKIPEHDGPPLSAKDFQETYGAKGDPFTKACIDWATTERRKTKKDIERGERLDRRLSVKLRQALEGLFAHFSGMSEQGVREIKRELAAAKRSRFQIGDIRRKTPEVVRALEPGISDAELEQRIQSILRLSMTSQEDLDDRVCDLEREIGEGYKSAEESFFRSHEGGTEVLQSQIYGAVQNIVDVYRKFDDRDYLTSMPNLRSFLERGRYAISDAEDKGRTLVFFNTDADLFKGFNAVFGHDAGDVILQKIAQASLSFGREYNVEVSRVGGEEMTSFFVELNNVDSKTNLAVLHERIDNALAATLEDLQSVVGSQINVKEVFVGSLLGSRASEMSEIIRKSDDYSELETLLHSANLSISDEFDLSQTWPKIQGEEHKGIREMIIRMLPLGTVTMGYIEVDFKDAHENTISPYDIRFLNEWVNGDFRDSFIKKEDFDRVFKGFITEDGNTELDSEKKLTYVHLKRLVKAEIAHLEAKLEGSTSADNGRVQEIDRKILSWNHLIDMLYNRRFGRIIQATNRSQENQKTKKRDAVGYGGRFIIKVMDHEEQESTEEVQKIVFQTLKKADQDLRIQLVKEKEKSFESLAHDPRLKRLDKMHQAVLKWFEDSEVYGNVFAEIKKYIDDAFLNIRNGFEHGQQFKYFEGLTESLNNDYLMAVARRDLWSAYENLRKSRLLEKMEAGYPPLKEEWKEWQQLQEEFADDPKKKEEIEKEKHYTLVSFDFDNLKAVNAAGGYFLGDVVLRQCALNAKTLLRSQFPKAELVRVTGGEEFVVTFPGVSSEEAAAIMKEINKKNKEEIKELLEGVSVSRESAETLMKEKEWGVDTLEEAAKKTGGSYGDTVTMYDLVQIYIALHTDRRGIELEKIGTVTAGVVDICDIPEMSGRGGRYGIEAMRSLADTIGEEMKDVIKDPVTGETYKGTVLTLGQHYRFKKMEARVEQ